MQALFLAAYSVGIVGIVDNVLKPVLIKGGIEMHGGVVFFALLGGFAAFGLVGLVLGPMSVALLIALLRIYRRDGSPTKRPHEPLHSLAAARGAPRAAHAPHDAPPAPRVGADARRDPRDRAARGVRAHAGRELHARAVDPYAAASARAAA
jgi:hypothetical protein